MKQSLIILFLVAICQFGTVMGDTSQFREIDSISGQSLVAINSSLPELRKLGLDFRKYKIVVYAGEHSIFVIFKDPTSKQSQFGSLPGQLPGFEVELSEDGKTVVRAQFIK